MQESQNGRYSKRVFANFFFLLFIYFEIVCTSALPIKMDKNLVLSSWYTTKIGFLKRKINNYACVKMHNLFRHPDQTHIGQARYWKNYSFQLRNHHSLSHPTHFGEARFWKNNCFQINNHHSVSNNSRIRTLRQPCHPLQPARPFSRSRNFEVIVAN